MEEQIEYIEDLEEYRKKNIIITPNTLFSQYLNILYPNLILREDTLSETTDLSNNSNLSSYKPIYNHLKNKPNPEKPERENYIKAYEELKKE